MLTIQEAMALPAFEEATLIAGLNGKDAAIKWVTTIEIIEDISRFNEGEFVITTGYGLSDKPDYQDKFIELIHSKKLAGIAIYVGFYMKSIPDVFIREADKYKLALIEIPSTINFSTITKALLEQLANKQIRLLEDSLHIHQEVTRLAFNLNGLADTLIKLSPLMNASIFVFDESFCYLSSNQKDSHNIRITENHFDIDGNSIYLSELYNKVKENADHIQLTVGQYTLCLTTIQSDLITHGYAVTVYQTDRWSEMDTIVSDHITTLIGIELVKKHAVEETKIRIQGEFLEEILHKEHVDYKSALKYGERLGYDLTKSHSVVYIKIASSVTGNYEENYLGNRLHQIVLQTFQEKNRHIMALPKLKELYALVPVDTADYSKEQKQLIALLHDVQKRWLTQQNDSLQCGIGECYPELSSFSKSAREAELAVHFSHLLLGNSTVITYNDLGFYQVLIQMESAGISLENYYKKYLGVLADEKKPRRDLILTLEAYLANNCNIQQTASKLFIHRHTLKYRLAQIEKKTGIHLQSPDARLNLHLAIVAYKHDSANKFG